MAKTLRPRAKPIAGIVASIVPSKKKAQRIRLRRKTARLGRAAGVASTSLLSKFGAPIKRSRKR